MHLTTVHHSAYHSASPSAAKMNVSGPCLNMSLTSRHFLQARNIDDRESQGMHTTAIIGVIAAVIIGCLLVTALIGWAVKSNGAAFEASGGRRGRVVRHGNGGRARAYATSEKGSARQYQGNAGLSHPPRSYGIHGSRGGSGSRAPQFPGPRNGYSARSGAGRGPYQDGSSHSTVPVMEPRATGGSRNQYSNGAARSKFHEHM